MKFRSLLVLCILTLATTALLLTDSFVVEVQAFEVCKYVTEGPCDPTFDCGYLWDGTSCIPRCERPECETYEPCLSRFCPIDDFPTGR